MILILSNKWDISVDFVIKELNLRGHPFLRLNTEDLIENGLTITFPDFSLITAKNNQLFNLDKIVKVIWNRRPGKPYDFLSEAQRPSLATQKFVNDQWYSALESLQLLKGVTWINDPIHNDRYESKLRQLQLASKLGLKIPDTLVTNNPATVRAHFTKWNHNAIAKALYSPLIEEVEKDYFIFTNKISELDLSNDDQLRVCPNIFQELLSPKIDYRITVIGDTVITAKIENLQTEPYLDWRLTSNNLQITQVSAPREIERTCIQYLREAGLLFGAFDFVEHANSFYFLELNPNGEWGWLEKPHGLPISKTLCDLMIFLDSQKI